MLSDDLRRSSYMREGRNMSMPRAFPSSIAPSFSRRHVLKTAGAGFGYLAVAGRLGQKTKRVSAAPASARNPAAPLLPRPPHFAAKAKRIIFLFMEGATSQMDTWEYKTRLQEDDGKIGPGGGNLV